jgi:hypothetical protein
MAVLALLSREQDGVINEVISRNVPGVKPDGVLLRG